MDLNIAYMQLNVLLKAVQQEMTRLLPALAVPGAGTRQHAEAQAKFARWEAELARIERQLRAADASLASRLPAVRKLPREQQYPARQSIDDRRGAIAAALQLGGEVERQLWTLTDRFGGLTPVEKVQALQRLISEYGKQAESMHKLQQKFAAVGSQPKDAAFAPARATTGPGQDLFVTLAVIGRLLQILALKIAGRSGARRP